jgi:hypothetical protein
MRNDCMDYTLRSYNASSGPDFGPIRHLDAPRRLDIVDSDDPVNLLGSAQLVGWLFEEGKPIATYRLMVDGSEINGLFSCVDRRFELVLP